MYLASFTVEAHSRGGSSRRFKVGDSNSEPQTLKIQTRSLRLKDSDLEAKLKSEPLAKPLQSACRARIWLYVHDSLDLRLVPGRSGGGQSE